MKKNGEISVFNQDGEQQAVRYTNDAIEPHKNYLYNSGLLEVTDDNGDFCCSLSTLMFITAMVTSGTQLRSH